MFTGENNISTIATIGAATAGTIMGITAMFLAQNHEKGRVR